MSKAESIGIPKLHHDGRYEGKGTEELLVQWMSQEVVIQANLYILNDVDEVQP